MSTDGPNITTLELEDRRFPPPPEFAAEAVAKADLYDRAAADPEAFWLETAKEMITWGAEPTQGCDRSDAPFFKWFADGTLNVSVNCLDRHLEPRGDRVAFHWEGEPGDRLDLTYRDLHERVCRLANGLRAKGVRAGDRVAIYLGMVPEIVVAMLACARIGAPHTVVFGGFSPDSLRDRILDCGCTAVITGDGAWRGGKTVPLKHNADAALEECPDVHTCVVVRRTEQEIGWVDGRDVWYHELVADQPAEAEPEQMDAEDLLYVLYTSGTTGKPKGIVHTTGGYLTGVTATHAGSSTSRTTTSTGARPTSAGSPGTATSSTARSPTAPPASSTRAPRAPPTRTAGGRSSSATASRSSTAPPPPSGRS